MLSVLAIQNKVFQKYYLAGQVEN
ncbi:hypothetical protein PITCH_A2030197 [uncultured Desulfobacterium sp.]|uniref:Uncharacterized protein n=1 Tax=uncultured Desulfobacterium sp. TaxID=201089 RepID=A0A445MX99_9BACT|nr:hypothetical protein PITCH_A2030197 [uncultured Desulfobacterium sp.]